MQEPSVLTSPVQGPAGIVVKLKPAKLFRGLRIDLRVETPTLCKQAQDADGNWQENGNTADTSPGSAFELRRNRGTGPSLPTVFEVNPLAEEASNEQSDPTKVARRRQKLEKLLLQRARGCEESMPEMHYSYGLNFMLGAWLRESPLQPQALSTSFTSKDAQPIYPQDSMKNVHPIEPTTIDPQASSSTSDLAACPAPAEIVVWQDNEFALMEDEDSGSTRNLPSGWLAVEPRVLPGNRPCTGGAELGLVSDVDMILVDDVLAVRAEVEHRRSMEEMAQFERSSLDLADLVHKDCPHSPVLLEQAELGHLNSKPVSGMYAVACVLLVVVLPVCLTLLALLVWPEVLQNKYWVQDTCQVSEVATRINTGPSCSVQVTVLRGSGNQSIQAHEAMCYSDWGCRKGRPDGEMKTSCASRYNCNNAVPAGNGSDCIIPCWYSPDNPQDIIVENVLDIPPVNLMTMAMVGPIAFFIWAMMWTWFEARSSNPRIIDREAGYEFESNCCTPNQGGVMWSLMVFSLPYWGMALLGCMIVATHASSHIDCSSNLVVWPLVALYSMMGTLLVCYALCPVAAPSQHKLIYQFALWPKIVQVVLVLFSGASLAIVVMSQEAYGCTNHRLYVSEWMFACVSLYFGAFVSSVVTCCCPVVGFALPLPRHDIAARKPSEVVPLFVFSCCDFQDYRPLVAVVVVGATLLMLSTLVVATV